MDEIVEGRLFKRAGIFPFVLITVTSAVLIRVCSALSIAETALEDYGPVVGCILDGPGETHSIR